jgi:hypothetical protein
VSGLYEKGQTYVASPKSIQDKGFKERAERAGGFLIREKKSGWGNRTLKLFVISGKFAKPLAFSALQTKAFICNAFSD